MFKSSFRKTINMVFLLNSLLHWSRVVPLWQTFFFFFTPTALSLEVSNGPYCSLLTCWHTAPVNGAARDPSAPASPAPLKIKINFPQLPLAPFVFPSAVVTFGKGAYRELWKQFSYWFCHSILSTSQELTALLPWLMSPMVWWIASQHPYSFPAWAFFCSAPLKVLLTAKKRYVRLLWPSLKWRFSLQMANIFNASEVTAYTVYF